MKVNIERPTRMGRGRTNKVVVHSWDTWCCASTLSKIIAPLVKRFLEDSRRIVGAPIGLSEEEWEERVQKIIWSMNEIATDESNRPREERPPGYTRHEWDKMFWSKLSENSGGENPEFDKAWSDRRDKEREYQRRIQEGCELLGKHFLSLWW